MEYEKPGLVAKDGSPRETVLFDDIGKEGDIAVIQPGKGYNGR